MPVRLLLSLLAVALVVVAAGCGDDEGAGMPTVRPGPDTVASEEGPVREVPLRVVESPHGGGVLAFAPVMIEGEGPFPFALDTGASSSVIDRDVAEQIGLEVVGRARQVTGVSGQADARVVRVEDWAIGEVDLDAARLIRVDLPDPERQAGLAGLLGSDVLSDFGAVTVDYSEERLVLRAGR